MGGLHTGDLGYYDEKGFIYIVDRKKDMIVSGGENVYSRDVEEILYKHPGISEVAVIGIPDPVWVERVHAVVVLKRECHSYRKRNYRLLQRSYDFLQSAKVGRIR